MITVSFLIAAIAVKALLFAFGCDEIITTMTDIAFIVVIVPSLYADIQKSHRISFALNPIIAGVLLRITLLFWDLYGRSIFILPGSGNDSEMYYSNAVLYAKSGLMNRDGAFQKLMGRLFSLIGTSRLFGQFIVVMFSAVALIFFAEMLSGLDISNNIKSRVLWIVALLPNYAILSSVFLRESIISMFITISFWWFMKWMDDGKSLNFIMAFVCGLIASSFHSGSAAVAVGYIAILLLYDRKKKEFKLNAKNIFPAVIMVFVVTFLFNNYSDVLFGKMQNVNEITDVSDNVARGGSSYAQYVGDSSNPLNMVIYTIPRMFFFIASPLPFQWRGISDIIAFCFSSAFFIATLWLTIIFFRSKRRENRTLVIAICIVLICTLFVFGWGVNNAGTACRHRDKIITICGLLLALAYSSIKTECDN